MKYIMIKMRYADMTRLVPVMFPDVLSHEVMALHSVAALQMEMPIGAKFDVISAGFTPGLNVMATTDKSVSLGLESRPEDRGVINSFDYHHGIV